MKEHPNTAKPKVATTLSITGAEEFTRTVAAIAEVPKSEIEELERNRVKRASPKRRKR
jgi:hypothetical protein